MICCARNNKNAAKTNKVTLWDRNLFTRETNPPTPPPPPSSLLPTMNNSLFQYVMYSYVRVRPNLLPLPHTFMWMYNLVYVYELYIELTPKKPYHWSGASPYNKAMSGVWISPFQICPTFPKAVMTFLTRAAKDTPVPDCCSWSWSRRSRLLSREQEGKQSAQELLSFSLRDDWGQLNERSRRRLRARGSGTYQVTTNKQKNYSSTFKWRNTIDSPTPKWYFVSILYVTIGPRTFR